MRIIEVRLYPLRIPEFGQRSRVYNHHESCSNLVNFRTFTLSKEFIFKGSFNPLPGIHFKMKTGLVHVCSPLQQPM